MRIDEFASAEEQLALWKLVSNTMWSALATQAEQERRARAEKAATKKRPARSKRRSTPKSAPLAVPKAPPPPTPADSAPTEPKQQVAKDQPSPNTYGVEPRKSYGATGVQPRASIQPQLPMTPIPAAPQTKQPSTKQPKPRLTARAGGFTV